MKKLNIAVISSALYYKELGNKLEHSVIEKLEEYDADYDIIRVAGAFELPFAMKHLSTMEEVEYDGVIALGIVIRGETSHYDVVVDNAARGLMDISLAFDMPLGLGLVTVENEAQAQERVDSTRKDTGGHAVVACMDLIKLQQEMGY